MEKGSYVYFGFIVAIDDRTDAKRPSINIRELC